jgi:hypothetical protein
MSAELAESVMASKWKTRDEVPTDRVGPPCDCIGVRVEIDIADRGEWDFSVGCHGCLLLGRFGRQDE